MASSDAQIYYEGRADEPDGASISQPACEDGASPTQEYSETVEFPDPSECEAAYNDYKRKQEAKETEAVTKENKRLMDHIDEVQKKRSADAAAEPEGFFTYDDEEPFVYDHDLHPDEYAGTLDDDASAEIIEVLSSDSSDEEPEPEPERKDGRGRGFVCTIYEYEQHPEFRARVEAISVYSIFGKEICPTTGRPHLQGYFYTKEKFSERAIRNKCRVTKKGSFWVEPQSQFSSIQEAVDYCKKGGDWTEKGEQPAAPGRAKKQKLDWAAALKQAQEGKFDDVDARIHFLHRGKMEQHFAIASSLTVKSLPTIDNLWLYGDAGSGKTEYAWNTYNPEEVPGRMYVKGPNKWWCNYNFEPVVLIDDFDIQRGADVEMLKHWADKRPFQAETKGVCSRLIRPKTIIITSNYHPNQIWQNKQDLGPILRRFKIIKFTCEDGVYSHVAE